MDENQILHAFHIAMLILIFIMSGKKTKILDNIIELSKDNRSWINRN